MMIIFLFLAESAKTRPAVAGAGMLMHETLQNFTNGIDCVDERSTCNTRILLCMSELTEHSLVISVLQLIVLY